jgi:EAL domain-containing protein (putative c-di-GMP-specific phosphodiesterase class I)
MWQATAKGPDSWEFMDADAGEQSRRSLLLRQELASALDGGAVQPWLMPVVDLASGQVSGYEVLARWVEPDGTVRLPAEFLAAAEDSHLILDLDRRMISESVRILAHLPEHQHLAVNVSGASLTVGSVESWVGEALAATGVSASRLHLEVTETALFGVTREVHEVMQRLRDRGIRWWADDFGTGFSSLTHLRDLPVHGLKLDRSFTAGLSEGTGRERRLAEGLVGLARGLGLATVAEGIETVEQSEILADQGWLLGQGWLFGRPQSAATVLAALPT